MGKNKTHLLGLLESANDNTNINATYNHKKHKRCKACIHKYSNVGNKLQNENKPQKLITIYLPNDNTETLEAKLRAKDEELENLKKQTIQINEYLMNDRNKAQETLTMLRNEHNAKFESLQKEIERLSREHLYNLKEYLVYRRNAKQEIEDLQMNFLQMKPQNNKIKQKCNHKV